jgi:hypothetical protein
MKFLIIVERAMSKPSAREKWEINYFTGKYVWSPQ